MGRLDVVVVGDAILDAYLCGRAARLSREAPVPVISLDGREHLPGGAANVAANTAALGARTRLVSAVGDDAEGDRLLALLAARGIGTEHVVRVPGRTTNAAQRLLAGVHLVARFDQGPDRPLDGDAERALCGEIAGALACADVVIVSDYDLGVFSEGVVSALVDAAGRRRRLVVVDGKRFDWAHRLRPTVATPNYDEAVRVLAPLEAAVATDRAGVVEAHGERLLDLTGAELGIVTLDRDGAVVVERGRPSHRTYPRRVREVSGTGAGDTFAAALALALGAGASSTTAAEIASAAAAVSVAQEKTGHCDVADLRRQLLPPEDVVLDAAGLVERAAAHRRAGRAVVFTNGCFDLLHRGHVAYLNEAKTLGDVLVVAVNDDASVRRLKGPGRPITPIGDRLEVLSALSCIDHVVAFPQDSPASLIEATRPDVFVKGGDYRREEIPEAPLVEALGGRVEVLRYVADHSTTRIVEGILASGSPSSPLAR
jgi:D-beta-D-heptose 7-phosphate kinase/D-beta-D-heptose 1-phosphate adenosyltransferase